MAFYLIFRGWVKLPMNLRTVCELENMTHRNSELTHEKWWIFPYSYMFVYQRLPMNLPGGKSFDIQRSQL